MRGPTFTRSGFIYILVLLLLSQFGFGKAQPLDALPADSENDWIPFVPDGEEFSAMIPALPTILNEPANYIYRKDGEKVLRHRDYSGYKDGLVFIIESYKVARPQKLMDALIEGELRGATFEREITLNGLNARQYRSNYLKVPLRIIGFVTREHVYFLKLTTLEETNSAGDKFLAGFRIRTPQDKEYSYDLTPASADIKQDEIFSPRDVTRKAVIAWKPIPGYTEKARVDGLIGSVILEGVFGANGYVTNVKVTREMKDGMTERAIEYARNIRFFPAEKDGKPVAQRMVLEYNFKLY